MNKNQRWNTKKSKQREEKKLLMLEKEYYEIKDKIRNLGYIKTSKPYRKKMFIKYRVKQEFLNTKLGKLHNEILPYFNIDFYSNLAFTQSELVFMSRFYRPKLRAINEETYNSLREELQDLFFLSNDSILMNSTKNYYYVKDKSYYELYSWTEKIKIEKRIDPELERRKQEIENYITKNNLWPKINKIRGVSTSGGKNRMYNHLNKKSLTDKYIKDFVRQYDNYKH